MYGYIDSNGNKHLLSGQQDIPQYTMEQYTALSVKPDIWVCTNYDSSSEYGIDSANVKYGNTSVEAKLNYLTDDIIIEQKSFNSVTISANSYYDVDFDTSKTGYTAIGSAGWIINGNANFVPIYCSFVATNTLRLRIKNLLNSEQSCTGGNVLVIYKKN